MLDLLDIKPRLIVAASAVPVGDDVIDHIGDVILHNNTVHRWEVLELLLVYLLEPLNNLVFLVLSKVQTQWIWIILLVFVKQFINLNRIFINLGLFQFARHMGHVESWVKC